jgi:hypothetical protein
MDSTTGRSRETALLSWLPPTSSPAQTSASRQHSWPSRVPVAGQHRCPLKLRSGPGSWLQRGMQSVQPAHLGYQARTHVPCSARRRAFAGDCHSERIMRQRLLRLRKWQWVCPERHLIVSTLRTLFPRESVNTQA